MLWQILMASLSLAAATSQTIVVTTRELFSAVDASLVGKRLYFPVALGGTRGAQGNRGPIYIGTVAVCSSSPAAFKPYAGRTFSLSGYAAGLEQHQFDMNEYGRIVGKRWITTVRLTNCKFGEPDIAGLQTYSKAHPDPNSAEEMRKGIEQSLDRINQINAEHPEGWSTCDYDQQLQREVCK